METYFVVSSNFFFLCNIYFIETVKITKLEIGKSYSVLTIDVAEDVLQFSFIKMFE